MTGRNWPRFAAGVVASALLASPAHADKWSPWIEAGGTLSTERDRGEVTGFAPLLQNGNSLLFADVKGKLFSESVKEGNFALGYRMMTEPGWNLGVWGGYDIRESENGNTFGQAAFGVEALSRDYDVRLNGYVPTTDPKAGGGLTTVELVGSQIFLSGGREVPLWGIDGELGWRVPLENMGADPDRHELRLYAGGYRFDDSELSEPVQGPRLRAEWRVFDAIPGLSGSQLSLQAQFQHDDYRDDQWEAGFRLRIPLFAGDAPAKLTPIERRMAEPLVRDTDIVTAPSRTEKVADALTGVTFDRVARVNGAGDLEAVAVAAGANSLIVVDGGAGDVTGGVIDGDLTIAGGGSTLALRGVSSGTTVNFRLPGTLPTLIASGCGCGDVFELLGSNLHFTGLLLDGDMGSSPLGFYLDSGQTGLHFTNMEIRGMSFAAIGGDEDNEIFVDGVTFYENVTGIYVENRNEISIRNSIMDILLLAGISADSDNNIVVENVEIREVDAGSAIRVNNGNTIAIDDALFETMWDSGVEGNSGNTIVANNLTVRDTAWNSINLNIGNTLTLTNSTLEDSDNDGLSAISDNDLTLSGIAFRNIALSAIYIEDGNTLAISESTFEGTIGEDILTVGGTGNALSGSGNENNATVGNNLCTAAPGSFTGTIGFDGGPDIVDGSCP